MYEIQIQCWNRKNTTEILVRGALTAFNLDDTFTLFQIAGRNSQQFRKEEEPEPAVL